MAEAFAPRSHLPILVSFLLFALLLGGCAATAPRDLPVPAPQSAAPPEPAPRAKAPTGERLLAVASSQVGTPYCYGGAEPGGFDCSGLVQYSYSKLGIAVPRTSGDQFRRSRSVEVGSLRPGDLVFFRVSPKKVSHVGIYAGDHRFIHSPSTGKKVSYASLNNPYWRKRLAGAGRLH